MAVGIDWEMAVGIDWEKLVFVDTETTGLFPWKGHVPWEIAIVTSERVDDEWLDHHELYQIKLTDEEVLAADPFSLEMNGYWSDRNIARRKGYSVGVTDYYLPHPTGRGRVTFEEATEKDLFNSAKKWNRKDIAESAWRQLSKKHVVGAVPNFDDNMIAPMVRQFGMLPRWHYHLIDVETLAVGYLAGMNRMNPPEDHEKRFNVAPPWNSDELMAALGVDPPEGSARHSAMGDALWAKRVYEMVMSP